MPVYGKSKRKTILGNNRVLLSPTRHRSSDEIDSLCSRSSSIISSFTSCSSSTLDSIDVSSDIAIDKEFGLNDSFHSNFKAQNTSSSNLNTLFTCFEDMENEEYRSVKTMKLNNRSSIKKTTLYGMEGNLGTLDTDISESSLSRQVFENVNTLNQRISELEANASNNAQSFERPTSMSQQISNSKSRHYGGAERSFKMNSKSLSEDEEDDCQPHDYEITSINNPVHCKSFDDLKFNNCKDMNRLDLDLIEEKVNHLLRLENSKYELLELTLDLLIKLRNNDLFSTFLRKECQQKDKVTYTIIRSLISRISEFSLFSLLLLFYFEIEEIEIDHMFNDLLRNPDLSLTQYTENISIPKSKKLLHCLLSDWSSEYSEETVCGFLLQSLLKANSCLFLKFKDDNRNTILRFLESCLLNDSSKILLDSFEYLKLVSTSFDSDNINNIVSILSKHLIDIDSNDTQIFNSLLEVVISIVCNHEAGSRLLSVKNWSKMWSIINDANNFGKTKLNPEKEKQVLLSVGFAFSFLDSDSNLNEDDILSLRNALKLCSKNLEYSTLQYHCIGYIICIAFHFLNEFNLLNDEDSAMIKTICATFRKSGVKFENKVGDRIQSIIDQYELVNV
ncbi:hypothetical protein CANINC_002984 [Pichia inconspicua]|uniref:Wings apart-like protein C-terminal domain-containing protein n=1 Tax=Pichia inconspicua TaxID=52247 RepID=A0A4T0X049_9ASCO|nr:hypothetical protein CANINC_002984 [[Candida] inconspicua]